MAPPRTVVTTSSCSLLLIYQPRKDERLSWPGWLTYSGRFSHITGHPSVVGWAQEGKARRSINIIADTASQWFGRCTVRQQVFDCKLIQKTLEVLSLLRPIVHDTSKTAKITWFLLVLHWAHSKRSYSISNIGNMMGCDHPSCDPVGPFAGELWHFEYFPATAVRYF